MDLSGQPQDDPQIWVKNIDILDADALAMGTKQFAVLAVQPDLSSGQV